VWRAVHLTSIAGCLFAILHALQAGTDTTETLFQAGVVAVAATGVYALAVRVLDLIARSTSK
jgi:hypothetical protein